jgi:hypothetical protein
LGITYRKLKGKSHISLTADRGKRRLALMRRVAGVKWGCTTETLANTYKMYVRPTLEYGMEVFPADIPNETKQLDIVQNQALRIITGGVKTTPITAMEIYNYLIKIIRTLLVPRRTFVWTLTLTNTNTLKIITVKMACTPGKN